MQLVHIGDEKFQEYWYKLWKDSEYQYPLHTSLWGQFYKKQLLNNDSKDMSFIIVKDNIPIFMVLIASLCSQQKNNSMSWYGYPAISIQKSNLTRKEKSAIRKILNIELIDFSNQTKSEIISIDLLMNNRLTVLSETLIDNGGQLSSVIIQEIDLKLDEKQLKADLRKSYKGDVKWGINNLDLITITDRNVCDENMDEFINLHVKAAGRETRSKETWNEMRKMVESKEAFCVLGYLDSKLVTAGFFPYSDKICFYGVAASNRDMWDKPLGHAVVWVAIQYAKILGCKIFELGQVDINSSSIELNEQDNKERNISLFKTGFGGYKTIRQKIIYAH